MLGPQVASDLHLDTVHSFLPLQTTWGRTTFTEQLYTCVSEPKDIKRRQLPLLSIRTASDVRATIRKEMATIKTDVIDDCLFNTDTRVSESVGQILWVPNSIGAFLNTSPFILNMLCLWKTILLPGFAILMPLIAIIIPFFVLRFLHPEQGIDGAAYITHLRSVLLQQITIPTLLRSRGAEDRLGSFMESLFIGMTLVMFISSLWNQITTSLHLRTIWFDLESRGSALHTMIGSGTRILSALKSMSSKQQRAVRHLIDDGQIAIDACEAFAELDSVATFGSVWNTKSGVEKLKAWIGLVDVYCSISELPVVCFPKCAKITSLTLKGVIHPEVPTCVPNTVSTDGHIMLTGPNRGGKSTFCKAVALAVITAQSWGFAWATSMTFRPFATISTALESCGKLGVVSTFEAEIEFAKTVLADRGIPQFVMMDEIFHSTNATDGVAASEVFLTRLYEKPDTVSIISTHYRELTEIFAGKTQQLQLVTNDGIDGKLSYTYKVETGVSTKSSVLEILAERGLSRQSSLPDVTPVTVTPRV